MIKRGDAVRIETAVVGDCACARTVCASFIAINLRAKVKIRFIDLTSLLPARRGGQSQKTLQLAPTLTIGLPDPKEAMRYIPDSLAEV